MDDLDQIKSDPGVLRVYGQHVRLKKTGDKFVGLCPFHPEKTPSFTIHADLRWHCYGGCGSGNVYQFLERLENIPFKEAVERVKKEIGGWVEAKEKVEQVFKPVSEPKVYKTIDLEKWTKLEEALTRSSAALDWLNKERGIGPGTAQRLHLGFVQNLGNLAVESGADIADKGWVAFPCISGNQILSVKYRSIVSKKFSRQPGMATALFNTESVDPFEPLMLVEGEIDCLTLEQSGFRSVSVPSAGTKLTPEMKDKIMEANCVILAGDTDAPGTAYLEKLWKELGERTFLLKWPDGFKDANEFFLKGCNRDQSIFRTKVDGLISKAKATPLPDIYSIQEVMKNGEDTSLANREDRLRFPWSEVDKMAILLPGSVLGLTSTNTSMGKTPFAIQFSSFGARKYNETVVNWQCELSPTEISVIVAAQVLRKNRNFLTKEDLKVAAEELQGVQYYIGNNSTLTNIMDVLDVMEAAIRRCGATVAVLDNLHYYTTGIDDENRVQTAAIKRIKQMAGQYGVKFVVVGQPRKATSQAKGKKTHITDAKGSGSFGDTCDSFMAIHRDIAKDEGRSDIYEEKVLVEMLKTRSKGVGKSSCYLHFFGEFASFEQLESNYEEAPGDSLGV